MADIATTVRAERGTPIVFDGVTKAYGDTTVLHGIDLDVRPGEFVALLGPSGCGKTTMLRCLAGLEQVSGGRILVGDDDVAPVPVNHRDMSVVFQAYSLFPHMTVAQNVSFGLEMRRVGKAERARRVDEALELVGLAATKERFAHQLSGGQQQRVALARALVTRPRALLLDEPLSALDAKVRVRLRDEIKAIQTELGITTIFVTHDQEEALAVADRIAVMRAGVIEQLGTPEELYRRPTTPFVASFVGDSNRIPGTYLGGEVRLPGTSLDVLPGSDAQEGDAVTAFVRPEQLRLDAADAEHGVPVTVVSSGFFGAHRRTVVRLDGGDLVTVQHGPAQQFVGDDRAKLNYLGDAVAVEAT
ncbi:ABC transporter ATP-binding protein [Gulosibacter massiliensis]|uniref:ABC transporter ATP-binding protein n=1 Tax=Gulosibacter massiliensis TaxID=2479839 RepID=UPI000F62DDA6|nr:ABC transporter ATP-binding protein [Gulosibacter massiliensis]